MRKQALITGATGLVGSEICRHMWKDHWSITGVARKQPAWWPSDQPFVQIDFIRDDIERLEPHLETCSTVIHLCDLAKNDIDKNQSVTTKLYETTCKIKGKRFYYGSSIRVYSGLSGCVDEGTPTRPAAYDIYGVSKQNIEKQLETLSVKYGLPITILRFGNVFSRKTPEKKPKPDDALTEFIYRGKNHHLISHSNVAFAVCEMLKIKSPNHKEVVNVTQEAAGENDYYFLEKQLSGRLNLKPSQINPLGRWLRFCLSRYRQELSGEYFVSVFERRLQQLDIRYPVSLLDSLKAVYASNYNAGH